MTTGRGLKVLVATRATQGARANDFTFVPDGELVAVTGGHDGETPDGACGCARSFTGLTCLKGTTTARVVRLPITRVEFARAYADFEKRRGFGIPAEQRAVIVRELLALAAAMPEGTVLERRGDLVQERVPVAPARPARRR